MKTNQSIFKIGDLIVYKKEFKFKNKVTVKSRIVAITDKKILLENDETFWKIPIPINS